MWCPRLSRLINIKAAIPRPYIVSKRPDSCCTLPHPWSRGYTKSSLDTSGDDLLLLLALPALLSRMRCALPQPFSSRSLSARVSSSLCVLAATGRACDTGRGDGRNKRHQNALPRPIVAAQWISVSEVTVAITFGEVCQSYIYLAAMHAIYSAQTVLSHSGSREHTRIRAAGIYGTYFLQ